MLDSIVVVVGIATVICSAAAAADGSVSSMTDIVIVVVCYRILSCSLIAMSVCALMHFFIPSSILDSHWCGRHQEWKQLKLLNLLAKYFEDKFIDFISIQVVRGHGRMLTEFRLVGFCVCLCADVDVGAAANSSNVDVWQT